MSMIHFKLLKPVSLSLWQSVPRTTSTGQENTTAASEDPSAEGSSCASSHPETEVSALRTTQTHQEKWWQRWSQHLCAPSNFILLHVTSTLLRKQLLKQENIFSSFKRKVWIHSENKSSLLSVSCFRRSSFQLPQFSKQPASDQKNRTGSIRNHHRYTANASVVSVSPDAAVCVAIKSYISVHGPHRNNPTDT